MDGLVLMGYGGGVDGMRDGCVDRWLVALNGWMVIGGWTMDG